ncbi:hypothetical protein ACFCX0_35835 [Streptomyces sp. NPDC056352]|uniref:hypothetical protein n=1 Tax=Streptomyces sp. NPDC056352 TaxID=3345791 RepID=UPI0035DD0D4D
MHRQRGMPPFDVPAQEIPAASTAAGSAGHCGMTAAKSAAPGDAGARHRERNPTASERQALQEWLDWHLRQTWGRIQQLEAQERQGQQRRAP